MKTLTRIRNVLLAAKKPLLASATFEQAVAAKTKRYGELRKLAAEVLYLHTKMRAEVGERRAELARLHHTWLVADRTGRHHEAQTLVRLREHARFALQEAEQELLQIADVADEAKSHLRREGEALGTLNREHRSVKRTERVHAVGRRMSRLTNQREPNLDEARLQIERIRAERALEAELGGRGEIGW